MLKNPLAISIALLSCLVALAFAKGKSITPEQRLKMQVGLARHPASITPTVSVKPGSLQSAN